MEQSALSMPSGRLNPLQVSLLRLFNREMTDDQVLELKRVLVQYYSERLKDEVELAVVERSYTQADFDNMLNENS
ncbi:MULTISPECIES: hypothetical protein [Spirosoma]|uniref:hypothetical protein n=1 Tax=Spirosoma TaxID=107 RepID=UPI000ADEE136|nr:MULTISPECIES: hypothetical protein [Spirosoma]MBN8823799.1 hypothetical protein [Spirosoma sp.]